jgi:hypothetical protein
MGNASNSSSNLESIFHTQIIFQDIFVIMNPGAKASDGTPVFLQYNA